MPITTIDPNTALIVVDLQSGVAHIPTVHPFDAVLANAARLADAFRAEQLPVVLVNVAGGAPGRTEQGVRAGDLPADWTDLLPELDQQPGDKTVTKYTWGAFHNTDLAEHLRELGVTQVVVCGISTAIGVESTARQAHEHGFHVALPIDAMTDLDAATHDNSIARIFPKLGETGTTDEVLAHLGK
ncbi:isochorismatase family protein [Nocardia sp. NEAU-G5]|uniref:Isochorismatase family protein n=1 Tax=Nocardia albiluteola TaxID=2842303 RepID=A0ABS6APU0_9NOCA|nr:isochorismatase family protein [Nocardia albiluteola]MBU3059948.1 isochorismatase family protein [Nocardia albiluteola]